MSYYCSYPNCGNTYRLCSKKSYFNFPKEGIRIKEWLQAMGMEELPKSRNKTAVRICSDHFTESDFEKTSSRRSLYATAVPQKLEKTL